MTVPSNLPDIMADAYKRIAELERRFQNQRRSGTVYEVDDDKMLARVNLADDADGEPFLGPWMAWKTIAAGGVKVNIPPTVGQQVEVTSESGDIADGTIDLSSKSTENSLPAAKGGGGHLTFDGGSILFGDGKIHLKAGDIILEGNTHLGGEGGQLVHRKGDADDAGNLAVDSATKVYAL